MKKRGFQSSPKAGGILRWSTACLLAGGVAGMTGCDRGVNYVVTEKDVEIAETQSQLEKMDSERYNLTRGEVRNNFPLRGLGYYHAAAHAFYEHPFNFEQDGRWFVDGAWQDSPGVETVAKSRPSPETLKKVEAALEKEQENETQTAGTSNGSSTHSTGHGLGMGNALMMYWLLSGNRGMFSPGAGFQNASGRAESWHRGMDDRRNEVSSHAAGNPGYQRMVEQSRSSGTPIRPGTSIRGGVGARRSGFSVGS